MILGFTLVTTVTRSAVDLSRLTPVPPDQTIPVEDFFRPGRIYSPSLNKSGTRVAAITSGEDDKTMLLILDVATWKPEILYAQNNKEVYSYKWLTDDRIMFNVSKDKRFADSMLVAQLGKKTKMYYLFRYGLTQIVGVPKADPLKPIVRIKGGTDGRDDLGAAVINAKLNVDTGRGAQTEKMSEWAFAQFINKQHIVRLLPEVDRDWGQVTAFQADREGELAYAYTIRDGIPKMHVLQDNKWSPSPIDLDAYHVHRVADTVGNILVTEALTSGAPAKVYELNVATGKVGEMIFQDEAYSFAGELYRDRRTDRIVGAIYDRAGPVSVWFDETYQRLQTALNAFFPQKVVRIYDSDDQARLFIVRVYSDQSPPAYHLVDLKQNKVTLIADSHPWLDPNRMQRTNIIQFTTAEADKLDAYVTLPAGASKENPPPLIVLPHGGPWARDRWGFNAEVQFLASRGYAVLQPNYRGSTGSGWKFSKADQWDFVKMHDDVTRATKALIRSGYVDPDRVAIMGSSFGGYLALMGAVHEPDLYQCAITFAGVFDWEESVKTAALFKHENPEYQLFVRNLGDPDEEAEKYERFSPGRSGSRCSSLTVKKTMWYR